ncbi:hypothetical protein [Flavobacterium sp.]|uniref:hypothetical protein n=1 Tax=Flavobacterium sp. TaxID=239 RepID=UPI002616F94F|nr:hypothetical protein [Flavobacterium sp.]
MKYFCAVKKCACILGILFLLKPVFPLFTYILNYQYIVENLCVNREKPQLSCNGKCHLAKEIAKEVDSEQSSNDSSKKESKGFFETLYYLPAITSAEYNTFCNKLPQKIYLNFELKPLPGYYNIIQPPPNV